MRTDMFRLLKNDTACNDQYAWHCIQTLRFSAFQLCSLNFSILFLRCGCRQKSNFWKNSLICLWCKPDVWGTFCLRMRFNQILCHFLLAELLMHFHSSILRVVLAGRGGDRPGQQHRHARRGDGIDEAGAGVSVSDQWQHTLTLEGQKRGKPKTQNLFDTLVLSMVYSAQQARHQEREKERTAWSEVLLQLANYTVYELRGNYLFSYAWFPNCHSVWDQNECNKSLALNFSVICIHNNACD